MRSARRDTGSLSFARMDRAIGSVRRYPLISVGLAAAVVLLGGRRLFDVVVRGVTLYTLLRRN